MLSNSINAINRPLCCGRFTFATLSSLSLSLSFSFLSISLSLSLSLSFFFFFCCSFFFFVVCCRRRPGVMKTKTRGRCRLQIGPITGRRRRRPITRGENRPPTNQRVFLFLFFYSIFFLLASLSKSRG